MRANIQKLQILRRGVQISVVAVLLLVPALARYNNYLAARELDRVLESWQGRAPGVVLGAIDSAAQLLPGSQRDRDGHPVRDRLGVLAHTQGVRGSAWSLQAGRLSVTDPLAAAESAAAGRHFPAVLAIGIVIPVLLTLVLGRIFCSWICPMGLLLEMNDKLRALLRFLEIQPRNLRVDRATKYGLLVAGLLLAAVLSVPVLGYVYPPAILSRETHDLVFAWFDRAEQGRFGLWLGSLSWMMSIVLAIVVVELVVSRRWWCRYVCPGGALYSALGWARPVRVRLRHEKCTDCALCVAACPMGLNPMKNEMGAECDSCGVCISSCEDGALGYGLEGPRTRPRSLQTAAGEVAA